MSSPAILTRAQLADLMPLDAAAVACMEEAFRALAQGRVILPPILHMPMPEANGELDVKTACVRGMDCFVVKLAPAFFHNPQRGLPTLNGMMIALNAETGLAECLLLDNGYLTNLRTAAAGAVAAKHLAREDARRAGILGAGTQARLQLKALQLVRPIESALLWARDAAKARACAAELTDQCGIAVEACADIAELTAAGDIIVTTTASTTPLIHRHHLRAGMHITAMGAGAPQKNEIAAEALAAADLFVCDQQEQCAALGELHHALEAGLVAPEQRFPQLGEIVSGAKEGRRNADDITLCDLTGVGVQDVFIADLARRRAQAQHTPS